MKWRNDASSRILFGTFNTLFFVCGFVEVVCGFLLLCDSKRLLLSRLLASPESGLDQPPFYYLALALLAAGLAICATSALGCWATYMPGYAILTIYFLLVLALVVSSCAGGVLGAVWVRCAGLASARGGAVAALQAHYAVPDLEHFTASVDLAQTEDPLHSLGTRSYAWFYQLSTPYPTWNITIFFFACLMNSMIKSEFRPLKCCGITDARNYDMSLWQLRRLGPRGMSVPLSCCVQLEGGSYLNPVPVNSSRCQEIKPNPDFRYVPGCLSKLEDWYQQQYLVLMLGLFVIALIKIAILLSTVFSCIRLKKRRQVIHSITMRTIDNNKNENIYENKMSSMHDDPITAKYIQPNNFYTPRARNPRIFPNKPNEMV